MRYENRSPCRRREAQGEREVRDVPYLLLGHRKTHSWHRAGPGSFDQIGTPQSRGRGSDLRTLFQAAPPLGARAIVNPDLASAVAVSRRGQQALAATKHASQPSIEDGHHINKDHQNIHHAGSVHHSWAIRILSLPVRPPCRLNKPSRARPALVHPDLASSLTSVLCSSCLRAPSRQAWELFARRRPRGVEKAVSNMSVTLARPTSHLL